MTVAIKVGTKEFECQKTNESKNFETYQPKDNDVLAGFGKIYVKVNGKAKKS